MKKKWLIAVIFIAVILLVLGSVWGYLSANSLSFSTGRCLVASNGAYLILIDSGPVVMNNCTDNAELFADIRTGDEIRILHDGIQETYPGGTGVYSCKVLSEGCIDDIPEDIIESLSVMGWLATDASGRTREIYSGLVESCDPVYQDQGNYLLKIQVASAFENPYVFTVAESTDIQDIDGISAGDKVWLECESEESGYKEVVTLIEYQTVSYEYGYANMYLELPAGWNYEICKYSEESATFGIDFWPADQTEGKLRLRYNPDGFYVCGTDLEETEIRLDNGLRAYQGTYDNHAVWDFISIRDLPGSYVILTENVDSWWAVYGEQAMDIIGSMSLAEGIIWENMAIELAERELKGEFEAEWADFDFCEGVWSIRFAEKDTTYTVYIGADGTVLDTTASYPDEVLYDKSVIYLYPEQETEVTVRLDFTSRLTTTYPAYNDGWNVIAQPDGTLVDPNTGRMYYCLFWEGIADAGYDISTGFVVAGENTAAFLEEALAQLGLTDKEANEFIIYWLPKMEGNAYNLISFQQEAYTNNAALSITPEPDSILRVFMAWKPLDTPVEVEPQQLETIERRGFTVVEWGGAELPG